MGEEKEEETGYENETNTGEENKKKGEHVVTRR